MQKGPSASSSSSIVSSAPTMFSSSAMTERKAAELCSRIGVKIEQDFKENKEIKTPDLSEFKQLGLDLPDESNWLLTKMLQLPLDLLSTKLIDDAAIAYVVAFRYDEEEKSASTPPAAAAAPAKSPSAATPQIDPCINKIAKLFYTREEYRILNLTKTRAINIAQLLALSQVLYSNVYFHPNAYPEADKHVVSPMNFLVSTIIDECIRFLTTYSGKSQAEVKLFVNAFLQKYSESLVSRIIAEEDRLGGIQSLVILPRNCDISEYVFAAGVLYLQKLANGTVNAYTSDAKEPKVQTADQIQKLEQQALIDFEPAMEQPIKHAPAVQIATKICGYTYVPPNTPRLPLEIDFYLRAADGINGVKLLGITAAPSAGPAALSLR